MIFIFHRSVLKLHDRVQKKHDEQDESSQVPHVPPSGRIHHRRYPVHCSSKQPSHTSKARVHVVQERVLTNHLVVYIDRETFQSRHLRYHFVAERTGQRHAALSQRQTFQPKGNEARTSPLLHPRFFSPGLTMTKFVGCFGPPRLACSPESSSSTTTWRGY